MGFLSSGLPRWVIEDGREDAEKWADNESMLWNRVYDVGSYEYSESDPQLTRDDYLRAMRFTDGEMKSFCQRCCVQITDGEYCADCAHHFGLQALSENSELARHLQHLNLMEEQEIYENDCGNGIPVSSEEGGRHMKSQGDRRDRIGRRKRADGCVPERFKILKDPKTFHEAHGHLSDEVTKKTSHHILW